MIDDSPSAEDPGWVRGTFEYPDDWERIKQQVVYSSGRGGEQFRWVAREVCPTRSPIPFSGQIFAGVFRGQTVGNFMSRDNEPLGVHVGYIDGRIEWNPREGDEGPLQRGANVLW